MLVLQRCANSTNRWYFVYAGLFILPWLAALLLGQMNWTQPKGDSIKITLVQPNISQDKKWLPEQRSKTLKQLYQQTGMSLSSDIIIWPENAVPLLHHHAKPFLQDITTLTRQSDSIVITGIPWLNTDNSTEVFHNSIITLGNDSRVYHKQKLVPFGEYVPLQQALRGLITFFNLPMSNFQRGPHKQAPLLINIKGTPLKIAPYICYEIVYPDFVRNMAKTSDLLLTISDDSWFGTSSGPLQHLQMARMRAIEHGKYLLRDTNTGVTAIIDHRGHVTERSQSFVQTTLSGEVWRTSGSTPYSRLGSWPILLFCGALVMISRKKTPSNGHANS